MGKKVGKGVPQLTSHTYRSSGREPSLVRQDLGQITCFTLKIMSVQPAESNTTFTSLDKVCKMNSTTLPSAALGGIQRNESKSIEKESGPWERSWFK